MDEFIVWSNSGQRFLKINEFSVSMQGKIILFRGGYIFDIVESGQEYVLCRDIGKTDTEGSKIYAESSIVEFNYVAEDTKLVGFFTFDSENLLYAIDVISLNGKDIKESDRNNFSDWWSTKWNHKKQLIYYSEDRIGIDFKIIGTLQDNNNSLQTDKELLDE